MAVQYAFGKIITQGLDLNVDAADPTSYTSGSSSWISVVNRSITGSIISCSYSSDFKGGLVFNNQSASVQFPGTIANYGTGSFTVEMAFRPDQINGIHYLVSDNSGSFPNWGVYLSGSAGSGKLFSFYNISSTVSCSVSSSSTFVTGSNYFVDTVFSPLERRTYINVEGNYDAVSVLANGTGSLTTTASLFLGNLTISSSQAYSGSIFSTKVYSTFTSGFTNFKSVAPRIAKPVPARASNAVALVVAGGGASPDSLSAGGGAGGFLLATTPLTTGTYSVFVGDGGRTRNTFSGSNGQTSSIANLVALGGGGGGKFPNAGGANPGSTGSNGGSGGGGGSSQTSGLRSAGGTGSISQGNNGGGGGDAYGSGGGGGAGNQGSNGVGALGGRGGDGLASSILGITTYYAGGGGGGAFAPNAASGGLGGGGNGSGTYGSNGSANTGGGAGGSGNGYGGADGGSGIVIIRYPGPQIATGGTVTSFQGDTIHTFTATGSSTFTVF
jgi:hypothetical protein